MLSRTPRLLVEPKFQGGAAKADPFSGRSWDTPAAFKSSPCSLREHPLPPARVGAQFLVTVWLQPPWGHSWDGPARVRPAKGCRGAWGGAGVDPDPTFSQGMRVVPLIYPGSGMGMAWEGQGDQGGEMVLPLRDNISAEPRLAIVMVPRRVFLAWSTRNQNPPVLLCKTEK